MNNLNPDPAIASSSFSQAWPVTWHVLFWVLLSLAINSMAQPGGKICGLPSRYRIYLSSSPFICTADAIHTLVRLSTAIIFLGLSPRKASKLVILGRLEDCENEDSEESGVVERERGGGREWQSHAWPRFIFFIMGTLPAAIKLCSFTGIPWTKTLGMMFVASFTVTESVALLARSSALHETEENITLPGIFGLTSVEFEDPQHIALRFKVNLLSTKLKIFDVVLFILAMLTHIVVIGWAAQLLWSRAMEGSDIRNLINWITAVEMIILLISALVLAFSWLGGWFLGPRNESHKVHQALTWIVRRSASTTKWLWMGAIVLMIFGSRARMKKMSAEELLHENEHSSWFPPLPACLDNLASSGIFLWGLYRLNHWGITRVCRRWPVIARALLVERVKENVEDGTGGEEGEKGEIDENAWMCFCFFGFNLVICVLWYAFIYDSRGTVNPPWTDVFGR